MTCKYCNNPRMEGSLQCESHFQKQILSMRGKLRNTRERGALQKVYAFYYQDNFIDIGTTKEISKKLNMNKLTFYNSRMWEMVELD